MADDILAQLKHGFMELNMEMAVGAAGSVAEAGSTVNPTEAIAAAADALEAVGKKFQSGEWYLAELVYAGEIAKQVVDVLVPLIDVASSEPGETVVVGTVAGDLHDLGKDIFITLAKSAGYRIIDLGVDVSCEKFISAVRQEGPLALGMSCLLTSTENEINKVIDELKNQGLREGVKVIIGGAALTEGFAQEAGADAFAPDAVTGVDIVKEWGAG